MLSQGACGRETRSLGGTNATDSEGKDKCAPKASLSTGINDGATSNVQRRSSEPARVAR